MNDLVERLRHADANSQQRIFGSRIFGEAADRISQQDAELERVRRELEETEALRAEGAAKNADMTLRLAEARKAAFIEAAEIAEAYDTGGYGRQDNMAFCQEVSREIANLIRAKSEETGR